MTAPINEHDLLAWIEGEPLPDEVRSAVEQALEADASLRARTEAMTADRAAIRAWMSAAESLAPPGLAEDVAASAEREALLSEGRSASEPGASRRLRITFPRLAAAASVALLVAGASMLPLLLDPPAGPAADQGTPRSVLSDSLRREAPAESAVASGEQRGPSAPSEESPGGGELAAAAREHPAHARDSGFAALDAAPAEKALRSIGEVGQAAPPQVIELDDAVLLLRERRLLIALRTTADLTPPANEILSDAPAVALSRTDAPVSGERRMLSAAFGLSPSGEAVGAASWWRADLPAEPAALERLLASLSQAAGADGMVKMLPSPTALAPSSSPDASTSLWWRRPVSEWRPHGAALIVVTPGVPPPSAGGEREGG